MRSEYGVAGEAGLLVNMTFIPGGKCTMCFFCLFFATGKLMLVSLYMVSSFQGFFFTCAVFCNKMMLAYVHTNVKWWYREK